MSDPLRFHQIPRWPDDHRTEEERMKAWQGTRAANLFEIVESLRERHPARIEYQNMKARSDLWLQRTPEPPGRACRCCGRG